jgi:uncharacterized NAD-dependent epimerase/dehydratase family protein
MTDLEPKYDGNAIVYCEGAFNTTYGKTAHGLVRFTRRYRVAAVIDSHYAGQDAGQVLDGKANGIPVMAGIEEAVEALETSAHPATHLVIGIATDGGVLSPRAREDVLKGIRMKLNIDSGLHHFLTDDREMVELADKKKVQLRDVRKPPPREKLHFYSGKIEKVKALKIAILGTDSAIGKRTTAWWLVQALEKAGYGAAMVGTGQTAWMQGADYCLVLDSLVNDFVAGEIEHAVYSAWSKKRPDVIVIEGQGSLMNPAYPGGFEILAAGRPDIVVLQHAPMRKEYDGFPGCAMHPLGRQIEAIELLSGKKVAAITINHEDMDKKDIPAMCDAIGQVTGLPAMDVLVCGAEALVDVIKPFIAASPLL